LAASSAVTSVRSRCLTSINRIEPRR
jgi:hypothetical protein